MSLSININTTSQLGILQLIEDRLGMERAFITGNTARLRKFLAYVNLALDTYTDIAIKHSGTAQFDDTNYSSHLPIIYFDIVSGQQEYNATTDEDGALILEYQKVGILESATDTTYTELEKVDQATQGRGVDIFDESNSTSAPYQYDQIGSSLILNPTPNYSVTNGIKALINREAQHFAESDTNKKPGVPGIHHEYFVDKPAYRFAMDNSLSVKDDLEKAIIDWEGSERLNVSGKIADHFGQREKDKRHVMTMSSRTSLRNLPPM